ncbi:CG30278, partial [Drosophila busckii]
MTGAGNSCRLWYARALSSGEANPSCEKCFVPTGDICLDCRKPPPPPSVRSSRVSAESKRKSEPEGGVPLCSKLKPIEMPPTEPPVYVRRQIPADLCAPSKLEPKPQKCCNLSELQNDSTGKNVCACRNIKSLMSSKEWTKGPRAKPPHKNSYVLDENTLVGRVFPITIRLRRSKRNCSNCGRDLYVSEYVTDASNLILLSDCCNVEVYDRCKLENWCYVPVSTISGKQSISKRVLDYCSLKDPIPEPQQEVVVVKRISKPKKRKGKGKKDKDKKDKGKKGKDKKAKK